MIFKKTINVKKKKIPNGKRYYYSVGDIIDSKRSKAYNIDFINFIIAFFVFVYTISTRRK